MNINEAEKYFSERTQELLNISGDGTVWVFVCASTLIEYLAKLVAGKDTRGPGYIKFIGDYMSEIRPEYASFTYQGGKKDLPAQMYHILRCGIVHSFSLIPDQKAKNEGRKRPIVLSHRKEGIPHLSPHSSSIAADAANFVAEDFVEDIQKTIAHIFDKAATDPALKKNIETWLNSQSFKRRNA